MSVNIKSMENINIYNYGSSVVIIPTRDKETQFTLRPATGDIPSMIPMTWSEIDYFNSNSNAIRNGLVRFSKDIEKEVYDALRIANWNEILFDDAIEDIILNPTLDKLQKIVGVKSVSLIERVKGVLTYLKNSGRDISTRVDRIITTRYNEISHGKMKTDIVLSPKDTVVASVVVEDVDGLKAENQAMKNQISELQSQMSKLIEVQSKGEQKPKSPGRPKKIVTG